MPAVLRSFAINANDFGRAERFYGAVFGWRFQPWGPPKFAFTDDAGPTFSGLLQERREPEDEDTYEQTFAVDNLSEVLRRAEAAGGRLLEQPQLIETVGEKALLADTEGNHFSLMRYLAPPAQRPIRPNGEIRYFAINADNVERARSFYEQALSWRFQPWGPPDYYQTLDAGLMGAIQPRSDLVEAAPTGFEMTVTVEDLKETRRLIEANEGRVIRQPYVIHGVGELLYFQDPEGNVAGLMQPAG